MSTTKKATKKAVKKTAVKKAAAPKPKKGDFTVTVVTGGETYEMKNVSDVAEALLSTGVKYTNTKVEITVAKGKKSIDKTFFKAQGLRYLKNILAARTFARNVGKMLT